jgi:hypothetical protein
MYLANNSWSSLLVLGGELYTDSALNLIFTVLCTIIGEMIFMKFIISAIIQKTRE